MGGRSNFFRGGKYFTGGDLKLMAMRLTKVLIIKIELLKVSIFNVLYVFKVILIVL